MAFCYDDSAKGEFSGGDMSRVNATKVYLNHFGNKLYLSFIYANGSRVEKLQAEKELQICERKMAYWERHANFLRDEAVRGMERLNKEWRSKP